MNYDFPKVDTKNAGSCPRKFDKSDSLLRPTSCSMEHPSVADENGRAVVKYFVIARSSIDRYKYKRYCFTNTMATPRHFLLVLVQVMAVVSFSMVSVVQKAGKNQAFGTRLSSTVDDEKAIQCFIVNAFQVEEEGAIPEVICTPDPDDYAWFNGLDRETMLPADGHHDDFLECVEGASPRGVPEWECKKKLVDDIAWQ